MLRFEGLTGSDIHFSAPAIGSRRNYFIISYSKLLGPRPTTAERIATPRQLYAGAAQTWLGDFIARYFKRYEGPAPIRIA